jgi:predicted ATPase
VVKKKTLLDALAERSYRVIPESARRFLNERLAAGLFSRPDSISFAHEILSSDIEKYRHVTADDHATFFDRG